MIALWLLALALPVAEESVTIPGEVSVLVLSKEAPKLVFVTAGECFVQGPNGEHLLDDLGSFNVRRGHVRACNAPIKRKLACIEQDRIEISCKEPIALRVHHTANSRVYGHHLTVTEKNRALWMVANVELEPYVTGVVRAELGRAPREAQIAQAVVARSFTLRAMSAPRHDDASMCDLTHCQVFKGRTPAAEVASAAPRVLVDPAGRIAPVFYHATCGGKTVSAKKVWGDGGAHDLLGVRDVDAAGRAWCRKSTSYTWSYEVDEHRLAAALGDLAERNLDPETLELAAVDRAGSRWRIGDQAGGIEVRGADLHQRLLLELGFSKVRSSLFVASREGASFHLLGHGLGHRVGLCQTGAIARAKAGQNAEEILAAYFPGLELAPVVVAALEE